MSASFKRHNPNDLAQALDLPRASQSLPSRCSGISGQCGAGSQRLFSGDYRLVERALKKAILHRKNSLFYKTRKGAQMGDLFMSLIHTCELNGANAFDYLTELLRHAEELKQNPSSTANCTRLVRELWHLQLGGAT